MKTVSGLGEFGLIRLLARGSRPARGVLAGIGDDCAVIRWQGRRRLLWTTDMLLAGRHFEDDAPPYGIGWKSLAVSISDIAAMGGLPRYALVYAGFPPGLPLDRLAEINRGIRDLAGRFRVEIVGGDTNACDRLILGTTVLGEVESRHLVLRSGARPGDLICVSGPLGQGACRHLSFLPRVRAGRLIARALAPTAMIDISDGLLGDFTRIGEQSGVGGDIFLADLPLAGGATAEQALVSGEEFELLFTVGPGKKSAVLRRGFYVVGKVTARARGIRALRPDGSAFRPPAGGYDHFRPHRPAPPGKKPAPAPATGRALVARRAKIV